MHRPGRIWAVAACCALVWIYCDRADAGTEEPHPAADFPSSEDYYPAKAKLWSLEGKTVIHFCVDVNGRLTADPTIERSSGNEDLDDGALAVAKAGDGHYAPASENGKPAAGCAHFTVNFKLADDPRLPTLSRRSKQLNNQLSSRGASLDERARQMRLPPDIGTFNPSDREQLMRLRTFARSAKPVLEEYATYLGDYSVKMDALARSYDVSEPERTAFSKYWEPSRAYLDRFRDDLLDLASLWDAIEELANYVDSAQPPISATIGPSAEQRVEIDALAAKVRAKFSGLQGRTEFDRSRPKTDDSTQDSQPTAQQPSAGKSMDLLSVAGVPYSAASMPNVELPEQLISMRDISNSCPYPKNAGRGWIEGSSLIQLFLDEAGAVSSVVLVRTAGNAELDASAVKCASNIRFKPTTRDGAPQASVVQYRWQWKMDWGSPDLNKCEQLKAAAAAHPSANSASDKPTATVCTCWEESGRVKDPQIVESAGSKRWDEDAISLARAGMAPRPPGHPGCSAYRTQFDIHR